MEVIKSKSAESLNELDLVKLFVNQLCDVFLPISFQINDSEEQLYYDEWPRLEEGRESIFRLSLLDGKFNIKFTLTSFLYLDFDTGDDKFIHESSIFGANQNQSANLIQALFKLIHSYWEITRNIKEKIYKGLKEQVAQINDGLIKKAIDAMLNVQTKLTEIADVSSATQNEKNNIFETNDCHVHIKVNRTTIFQGDFGRKSGIISGFYYLKYIIDNANKEHKAEDLFDNVICPTPRKVNEQKLNDNKKSLNQDIERVINDLHQLFKIVEEDIKIHVKEKRLLRKKQNNQTIFIIYRVLGELTHIHSDNHHYNSIRRIINEYITIVKEIKDDFYEKYYNDDLVKRTANELTKDLTKSRKRSNATTIKQAKVRDDIKAALKEISRYTIENKNDTQIYAAATQLIQYLVETMLIKRTEAGNLEPFSQVSYYCNTEDCNQYFIRWEQ